MHGGLIWDWGFEKGIFIWGLGFFFFNLFMAVFVGLVAVLVRVDLTFVDNSLGEE